MSFVIVGKKGWLYDEILKSPKKFGVESSVRFLDFVDDHDLPALYKKALCFALPSLYEGFGLPVLEAMAYSCPVVISNVSSLPEIAGNAGVYVEAENVQSIADGIHKTILEIQSAEGKKRIKAGLEQVKKFSWENAAKKTLEILEKVGQKELSRHMNRWIIDFWVYLATLTGYIPSHTIRLFLYRYFSG